MDCCRRRKWKVSNFLDLSRSSKMSTSSPTVCAGQMPTIASHLNKSSSMILFKSFLGIIEEIFGLGSDSFFSKYLDTYLLIPMTKRMVTSQNTPEPQSILPQSNESSFSWKGCGMLSFSQSIMKPRDLDSLNETNFLSPRFSCCSLILFCSAFNSVK